MRASPRTGEAKLGLVSGRLQHRNHAQFVRYRIDTPGDHRDRISERKFRAETRMGLEPSGQFDRRTSWVGRKVLVTGISGFVGSALASELLERQAEVVGITRDTAGLRLLDVLGIRRRLELAHGSITDFNLVQRVINDYEIDTVFHLAAQSETIAAERAPAPTFESNVLGTWTLLEAARLAPLVDRMVVASCAAVYGAGAAGQLSEDAPLLGLRPYDASKVCTDVLARSYGARSALPIVVVRLGTIYGPGDLNWSRIVPGTVRSILAGEDPVLRSDVSGERDFLHVTDAVSGCLRAAEELPEVAGLAINLGSGQGTSGLTVIELLLSALGAGGAGLQPQIAGGPSGSVDRIVLSSRLAQRLLGWRPWVPLVDGLASTINWYRDYLIGSRRVAVLQKTRA